MSDEWCWYAPRGESSSPTRAHTDRGDGDGWGMGVGIFELNPTHSSTHTALCIPSYSTPNHRPSSSQSPANLTALSLSYSLRTPHPPIHLSIYLFPLPSSPSPHSASLLNSGKCGVESEHPPHYLRHMRMRQRRLPYSPVIPHHHP